MPELTARVLIDNLATGDLRKEWGLAIYLEYRGRKLLLDTGAGASFAKNADALGIDLSAVEYGVLSHAHFDHADGLEAFFSRNSAAPFCLREQAAGRYYAKKLIFTRYIGVSQRTLTQHADRIRWVSGDVELVPGAWLIPHKTEGLEALGKRAGLYRREGRRLYPDNYEHEQSFVFETERGLVIFNSCSHGGADNILREVAETFPGRHIYAILGGFHLYCVPEAEVLAFAKRLREFEVERVITGHCTGSAAYALLASELGSRLQQLSSGFVFEV